MKTFEPVLRSCLNKPGGTNLKDDPQIHAAIDSRPLLKMTASVQRHMAAQAQSVAHEQKLLTRQIKDVR